MTSKRKSGWLTLAAAAGALVAVAGLAAGCGTGPAAGGGPVTGKAPAATAPGWQMQPPPEPAGTANQALGAVSCSSSSACLSIGTYDDDQHGYGQFAETWNGSRWTVRTVPDEGAVYLYGVQCLSARWCVAVGTIGTAGTIGVSSTDFVPVVDSWNGSAWTQARPPVPAGATMSQLAAVACSGITACTAVGSSGPGPGAPGLLAERWEGSAWKIQPVPAPSAGGAVLAAVACPAADACRAVGSDKGGLFSEVWDGSSWVIRPVPVPAGGSGAELNSVSCTAADSCEAVGMYSKGGTSLPLAEAWNGSRWLARAPSAVSGATSTGLDAVSCVSATDCEAAGKAGTMAGPPQVGVLEKWDGTTWSVQRKVLPAGDTWAGLSGISCTPDLACEPVGYHGPAVDSTHLLALRYSS
jgi:hypothetical protein